MNAEVYKSRWGFHPVSYATFCKLKELKKWYFQTVYSVARWSRWDRKTVHQKGPEPSYCPLFVLDQMYVHKYTNKEGHEARKYFPKTLRDHGVLAAFEQARRPVETPEEVRPLQLDLDKIDRLHAEAKQYFDTASPGILEELRDRIENDEIVD